MYFGLYITFDLITDDSNLRHSKSSVLPLCKAHERLLQGISFSLAVLAETAEKFRFCDVQKVNPRDRPCGDHCWSLGVI